MIPQSAFSFPTPPNAGARMEEEMEETISVLRNLSFQLELKLLIVSQDPTAFWGIRRQF